MIVTDGRRAAQSIRRTIGQGIFVAASDADPRSKLRADFVCDGTADDVEIQAAINSLASVGGKVALSEGKFTVSAASITPVSNLHMVGQGSSTTVQLVASADGRLISSTGSLTNVTFQAITFDGNKANQSNGAARDDLSMLFIQNITRLRFLDCIIQNCRHGAALRMSSCDHTLIANNQFLTNGAGTAFACDHSFISNSDHYRVVGNLYLTATDTGTAQDGVQHSSVVGNTYEDCGIGITVSASSSRLSKWNTVTGNVVKGNGGISIGIKVSKFGSATAGSIEDVTIGENVMQNCDRAMWLDQVDRVVVANNVLSTAVGDNKQLMLLGTVTPAMNDAKITGNIFYNTDNRGISFDTTANVLTPNIYDNTFKTVTTPLGGGTPATARVYNNRGYVTENSGTATIPTSTTGVYSVTVTHGLAVTPTLNDISVVLGENPTGDPGNVWVDTITSTQFNINCRNDPGASSLDVAWRAIVL